MRGSRIVQLALWVLVVFCNVETALADTIQYSFTAINVPGALETSPNGINGRGEVVGFFGLPISAFLYSGGSYTPFSFPGGTQTEAHGINNSSQIVGEYVAGGAFHGFLDSGGSFTPIDYPGAVRITQAFGINDSGQIVGDFFDGSEYHGFLDIGGSFTTITYPGAACPLGTPSCGTFATGINNSGQIVGYFGDVDGMSHGFLYSGGSFSTIDYPCPIATIGCATFVNGINDRGEIVGYFIQVIPAGGGVFETTYHGFLYSAGIFTTIDNPGNPNGTFANGINDSGQIVGHFLGPFPSGFLAMPGCSPQLISGASASPGVLWPPNHNFVDVTINYTELSPCTSTCTLTVTSNEPGPNEWIIVDANHVQLLADRNGDGSGRIYTITITCTNAGGTSTQTVTVLVPHDQGR